MPRLLFALLIVCAPSTGCGGTLYRGGVSESTPSPASVAPHSSPPPSVRAPDVLGAYAPPSVTGTAASAVTAAPESAPSMTADEAPVSAPTSVALNRDADDVDTLSAPEESVDTGPGVFGDLLEPPRTEPQSPAQYAQTDRQDRTAAGTAVAPAADATATDAVDLSGPLLVYTAGLLVAVYEVTETQDAIIEAITALGGYVSYRDDARLTMRVPVTKFDDALRIAGERGDVLSRNVQAVDVGEEFHDLRVRLANAEAMRKRIEDLLGRTTTIEEALRLEHELQRITEIIESLKGRIRFLSDRAAFSTIEIQFRAIADEAIHTPGGVELPIEWLKELGLSKLLDLQPSDD